VEQAIKDNPIKEQDWLRSQTTYAAALEDQ
jgi:hypothetical protein